MGNQDNWSTSKQIKIEREGEPRGIRRGRLKKGERRKGKKARMDEILAAKKECERYKQWIIDDAKRKLEHPEWYLPRNSRYAIHDSGYRGWFGKHQMKLFNLIGQAVRDGIVAYEDITKYWISLDGGRYGA